MRKISVLTVTLLATTLAFALPVSAAQVGDPKDDLPEWLLWHPNAPGSASVAVSGSSLTLRIPSATVDEPLIDRWKVKSAEWVEDAFIIRDRTDTVPWRGSKSTLTDAVDSDLPSFLDVISASAHLESSESLVMVFEFRGSLEQVMEDTPVYYSIHLSPRYWIELINFPHFPKWRIDLNSDTATNRIDDFRFLDLRRSSIDVNASEVTLQIETFGRIPKDPEIPIHFVWYLGGAPGNLQVRYSKNARRWEGVFRMPIGGSGFFRDDKIFRSGVKVGQRKVSLTVPIDLLSPYGPSIEVSSSVYLSKDRETGREYIAVIDRTAKYDTELGEPPCQISLTMETDDAWVYSSPCAPQHPDLEESWGEWFGTAAAGKVVNYIAGLSTGPLGLAQTFQSWYQVYKSRHNPVRVLPVAPGMQIDTGNHEIDGRVTVGEDEVSALVFVDYLGADQFGKGWFDEEMYSEPLELFLQNGGVVPGVTTYARRTLSTIGELEELSLTKSHIIVPKRPFSLKNFGSESVWDTDLFNLPVELSLLAATSYSPNGVTSTSLKDNHLLSLNVEPPNLTRVKEGTVDLTPGQGERLDQLGSDRPITLILDFSPSEGRAEIEKRAGGCAVQVAGIDGFGGVFYRTTVSADGFAGIPLGLPPSERWTLLFSSACRSSFDYRIEAGRTGIPLQDEAFPGFSLSTKFISKSGDVRWGVRSPSCIDETVCLAGAIPSRPELFLRLPGPKPNGFLWPTLAKFSTSSVEVRMKQDSTGRVQVYRLERASPGNDVLKGTFDRYGFFPESAASPTSSTRTGFNPLASASTREWSAGFSSRDHLRGLGGQDYFSRRRRQEAGNDELDGVFLGDGFRPAGVYPGATRLSLSMADTEAVEDSPSSAVHFVPQDDGEDSGATSSLTLISGTLAGENLSPSKRAVTVAPEEQLNGVIDLEYSSSWRANAVIALGAALTWRENSDYFDLGTLPTPATNRGLELTIENEAAPRTPGTYYLILAYRSEFNAGQVFSMTNWSVGTLIWNDGNDVADWSSRQIDAANSTGRAPAVLRLPDSTTDVLVPATAIEVRVDDAGGSEPPPPPGDFIYSEHFPDFRFKVRIGGREVEQESKCVSETVCVSGAIPGRSELFLRVVGPKPNGYLWPTIVRFTTSTVEVWTEQISTGESHYYRLEGATPGSSDLSGLFDRRGFLP